MKRAIATIKGLSVGGVFVLAGYLILNKIFHLQMEWAYSLIYILGVSLGGYAINYFDPNVNSRKDVKSAFNKIVFVAVLVISLIIMFLPISRGVDRSWMNILFFAIGLFLLFITAWWVEKREQS